MWKSILQYWANHDYVSVFDESLRTDRINLCAFAIMPEIVLFFSENSDTAIVRRWMIAYVTGPVRAT